MKNTMQVYSQNCIVNTNYINLYNYVHNGVGVNKRSYSFCSAKRSCMFLVPISKNEQVIKRYTSSGRKVGETLGRMLVRSRSPSPTGSLSSTDRPALIPRRESRLGSTLLPNSNRNARGYSTYRYSQPDKKQSKQAQYNNPKKLHKEIHRDTCKKVDCCDKFCKTHCDTSITTEAIGHGTHGKSPAHETDKTTVEADPNKDFSNQPKSQNIVFYDTPHATIPTSTVEPANTIINTDLKIQELIKKHEK